jgi:aspartyl-tRNA(Asn)/glutamyl-tRNA(Gln) amidotransferase subunit A
LQLYKLTAHELHDLLVSQEVSAQELNMAFYERIGAVEDQINAFVSVTQENALEAAREVDRQISQGEKIAPLSGIPVAITDNICTKGVRTTASSKMLANFVPPYNATVVERLAQTGATIMGKTNMDEFAMGSSTENSAFISTRNPWNTERVPGGSSGGSAAAVCAGEVVCALGCDTGGSIRQPAAFCGIVGLKPTYGAVSRYGAIPFASSLDQIGPMARDVTDCAWLFDAISGHDPKDTTSVKWSGGNCTGALNQEVQGLKIGIPEEYLAATTDPQVKALIENAAKLLESLGAVIEYTKLPHSEYALSAFNIIASAEASSNLARLDGVRYGFRAKDVVDVNDMFTKSRSQGFGPEVKRRIILGTYALTAECYEAYYLKAQKARTLVKGDFERAFEKYDILLSPVTPTPAFNFGDMLGNPMQAYLFDVCTASANLAGVPAISVPCGFVEGLPVGLQLIGNHFMESTLFRAAYAFEQNTGYHKEFPNIK